MKTVNLRIKDIEVVLNSRELNLIRSALLKLQTAGSPDADTNKIINEIDFKIFRLQQRESKAAEAV